MGRDLLLNVTKQATTEAEEGGSYSQPQLSPLFLHTTMLQATVFWI